MFKHSFYVSALVLMSTALFLRGEEPAPTAAQTKTTADRAQEMRWKLAKPGLNLEKGVDPNTKFQDAVDFFSEKAGVLILVDTEAFKTDLQIDNVGEQTIWLPKMSGLRLSTMLAKLTAKIGGTYLVLPEHILITTPVRANPLAWADSNFSPEPTVDVEINKWPLETALAEMSDLTGINIVLDARPGEKGRATVSAKFNNAPVGTAVRLLADMANMDAVALNGALYVTTRENAVRLREETKSMHKGTVPVAQRE
jgi:hypothetical protein